MESPRKMKLRSSNLLEDALAFWSRSSQITPFPPWKIPHQTVFMCFNLSSWKNLIHTLIFHYPSSNSEGRAEHNIPGIVLLLLQAISNFCFIYYSLLNPSLSQLSCYLLECEHIYSRSAPAKFLYFSCIVFLINISSMGRDKRELVCYVIS